MSPAEPTPQPGVSERIRQAAIALFHERGYHGTPVRVLARAVRVEAGSLYYHFPSKQRILVDILDRTLDDLLRGLERAIGPRRDPAERLGAAVRFHVRFHTERREEAFLSHAELRSLTPENLEGVAAKRDRYEQIFRDLLTEGASAGAFHPDDVKLAARAILAMCTGVTSSFSEGGPMSPDAIADCYADMVLRQVRRA